MSEIGDCIKEGVDLFESKYGSFKCPYCYTRNWAYPYIDLDLWSFHDLCKVTSQSYNFLAKCICCEKFMGLHVIVLMKPREVFDKVYGHFSSDLMVYNIEYWADSIIQPEESCFYLDNKNQQFFGFIDKKYRNILKNESRECHINNDGIVNKYYADQINNSFLHIREWL